MTEAPGDGGSKTIPKTVAEIFWAATDDGDGERTPGKIVQHALANVKAFDEGTVRDHSGVQSLSLMDLMANSGMEEDLIYASPELARGESVDERSLVFSLGVLIFERLTDRHPFGTADNTSRVARLRRYEMGSGVNFIPSLPQGLREILMRAMGPFPEERYLALDEMTADLSRFLEKKIWTDPQPKFTPPTPPQAAPPPQRPSKFLDAPTAVAMADPLFDISTGVHRIPIEQQGAQVQAVLAGRTGNAAPASPPPSSADVENPAIRNSDIFADLPEEWAPDVQARQLLDSNTEPEIPASTGRDDSPQEAPSASASATKDHAAQEPPSSPTAVDGGEVQQEAPTDDPSHPRSSPPGAPSPLQAAAPATHPQDETPARAAGEPNQPFRDASTALVSSNSNPLIETAKFTRVAGPFGRWAPLAFILIGAGLASLLFIILLSLQKKQAPQASAAPPAQATAHPGQSAQPPQGTHDKDSPQVKARPATTMTKAPPPSQVVSPKSPSPSPASAPGGQAKASPEAAAPRKPLAPDTPRGPSATPAVPVGLSPEAAAGIKVAKMIRGCDMAKRGNRGLRVAVYINPPNKILRAFANVKQGITTKQVRCIRKAVIGQTLEIHYSKPEFIEWSLKFSPAGETAKVVGPRKLKERLKKKI